MDFTRPTATRLFLFLSLLAFGGIYNTCSAMVAEEKAPALANEFIASKAFTDAATNDAQEAKDRKFTPGSPELNEFIGGKVGNLLEKFAAFWTGEATKAANIAKAQAAERARVAALAQEKEEKEAKVEEDRKAAEAAALKKQQEDARKAQEVREKARLEAQAEQQRKDKEEADRKKAAAAAGAAVSSDMRTAIAALAKDTADKPDAEKITASNTVLLDISELPAEQQAPAMQLLKDSLKISPASQATLEENLQTLTGIEAAVAGAAGVKK